MKFEKYLNEAIDVKTRRKFLMSIDHFPKGKIKIDVDGNDVEVKGDGKSVSFTYPEDAAEITSALVNIVDSIPSRNFDYNDKNGKITFMVKGM